MRAFSHVVLHGKHHTVLDIGGILHCIRQPDREKEKADQQIFIKKYVFYSASGLPSGGILAAGSTADASVDSKHTGILR